MPIIREILALLPSRPSPPKKTLKEVFKELKEIAGKYYADIDDVEKYINDLRAHDENEPQLPSPPENRVEAIKIELREVYNMGSFDSFNPSLDTEEYLHNKARSIASLTPELTLISDEEIKDVLEENQPEGFSWGVIHNTEMIKFRIVAQAQLDHDKQLSHDKEGK